MVFPLIPSAIVAAVGFLFWEDQKTKEQHRIKPPRELSPAALDEITQWRDLEKGARMRYFRPDVAAAIARGMRRCGLELVFTSDGREVQGCYKLRPKAQGAEDAFSAAQTAINEKLLVLATYSCAELADPSVDALVYFIAPDKLEQFRDGRHPYAVLGEPARAQTPAEPKPPAAEKVAEPPAKVEPAAVPAPKPPKRAKQKDEHPGINGAASVSPIVETQGELIAEG